MKREGTRSEVVLVSAMRRPICYNPSGISIGTHQTGRGLPPLGDWIHYSKCRTSGKDCSQETEAFGVKGELTWLDRKKREQNKSGGL